MPRRFALAALIAFGCSDARPDAAPEAPAASGTPAAAATPGVPAAPAVPAPAAPAAGPIATDAETVAAWFAAFCPSGGDNVVHAPGIVDFPRADVPFDAASAPPYSPHLSLALTTMQTEEAAYGGREPTPLKAKGMDDAAGRAADREALKARLGRSTSRILIDARVPGWRAWDALSAASGQIELLVAATTAPAMPANPDPARVKALKAEMKARPGAAERSQWMAGLAKANAAACPAVAEAYARVSAVTPDKRCAHLAGLLTEAVAGCTPEAVRGVMTLQYLMHPGVPYLRPQSWSAPSTPPAWATAETPWGEIVPALVEGR